MEWLTILVFLAGIFFTRILSWLRAKIFPPSNRHALERYFSPDAYSGANVYATGNAVVEPLRIRLSPPSNVPRRLLPELPVTLETVTVASGHTIGYRKVAPPVDGTNAGGGSNKKRAVVLVHGGMQSSRDYMYLAQHLARAGFTVATIDRRGRGQSSAYAGGENIETEASDVLAVRKAIGAEFIFGLSSGAVITLKAALVDPVNVKRIALYEPPIPLPDENVRALGEMRRDYNAAVANGNLGRAMVTVLHGLKFEGFITRIPRFAAEALLNFGIKHQAKQPQTEPGYTLAQIVPLFKQDLIVVNDAGGLPRAVREQPLRAEVLLLGGDRTQVFLMKALDLLQSALPRNTTERVLFAGWEHDGPNNDAAPQQVAAELDAFFR